MRGKYLLPGQLLPEERKRRGEGPTEYDESRHRLCPSDLFPTFSSRFASFSLYSDC